MSTVGTNLILPGAYTPLLVYETEVLPELEYSDIFEPSEKQDKFDVALVVITAIFFIMVVAWFNVLSRFFEDIINPTPEGRRFRPTFIALVFAVVVTIMTGIAYAIYLRRFAKS